MIGDTRGDILEGRKAGVKTAAVSYGWHSYNNIIDTDVKSIDDATYQLSRRNVHIFPPFPFFDLFILIFTNIYFIFKNVFKIQTIK